MNILLVTPHFPPTLKTSAQLFRDIAVHLREQGHDVTVVTQAPDRYEADDGDDEHGVPGIEVHRLSTLPLPASVPAARIAQQAWLGLRTRLKGVRSEPHDAVVAYSPPLPLALAAVHLGESWDATTIVNVQDIYPQTAVDLGLLTNRFAVGAAERIEEALYQRADHITVHSAGNKEAVSARGADPKSVSVVRNWVDTDKLAPGPRENAWREKLELDDEFLVSYAGTMGVAQGLEDVLDVAEALRGEDTVFLLVGAGTHSGSLREEAEERGLDNVRFRPLQPHDEYVRILQASDGCLVTLDRNLRTPVVPSKLQSIMACGRVPIYYAPSTSDGKAMLEEGDAGVFVESGDANGLKEAIRNLKDDPDERARIEKNARDYALKHHRPETCLPMYDKLLSNPEGD